MVHKRIKWIDTVRGLAIIMIIIGHSLDVYARSYFAAILFAVHVPIFFVVSGYLYKAKPTRKVLIGGLVFCKQFVHNFAEEKCRTLQPEIFGLFDLR